MSDQAPAIVKISTKPIKGQKMGTSGLRKTVKEVQQPHYIENVYQSILNALLVPSTGTGEVDWQNNRTKMMAIGGDGRYYNKEAIQIFIRMAYANHEKFLRPGTDDEFLLLVAHNGVMSTPSMSCVIRGRGCNLGGVILTASHNPGGPNADFGIKYNESNGGPAREIVTSRIGVLCDNIDHYFDAPTMVPVDLSRVGQPQKLSPTFSVQVIDSTDDYVEMLKTKVFDFGELRTFLQQSGFKFLMDSMNGVTGPYARRIFCQELGLDEGKSVMRAQPLEDFGGLHPDPNLTYAADLVNQMFNSDYDMGAASDGDGDRNMILGNRFFVTPSDSVAIMAEHATKAIPYFRKMGSLPGVARSMPTSTALDRVAKNLDIPCYETPTGWKFFGNLMDSGKCVLCGEESFGTGSDHVREKDGLFAVLCWLSICAYFWRQNGNKIVSIRDIVAQHWTKFGRSFYTRYDYEQVESAPADKMIETMRARIGGISTAGNGAKEAFTKGQRFGVSTDGGAAEFELSLADEFEYLDPVDGSRSMNQGLRFFFTDGSRIVFRLSGTGSTGATIRVYIETYIPFSEDKRDVIMNADSKDVTKQLHAVAMQLSRLPEITGRTEPTVIT